MSAPGSMDDTRGKRAEESREIGSNRAVKKRSSSRTDRTRTDASRGPAAGAQGPSSRRARRERQARSLPELNPTSPTPHGEPRETPGGQPSFDAYERAGKPCVWVSPGRRRAPERVRASVVLSTYNQPLLLERTLLGYARQSCSDFELIIADDGSRAETRACIARHQADYPVPLTHVWQPDDGFHKSRAVNRAALRASADYLIFSDGDCIPSRRFVEEHLAAARAGRYVVGGFVRLSEAATARLSADDVCSGEFERLAGSADRLGLALVHLKSLVYIALGKRRKPKFYGLNFSVSRADFVRVNGFDDTYHNSGKEDSDLRNRMQLAGIRATSLWYRPGVYHQFHPWHPMRLVWEGVSHYYNRPDLSPESPCGLRELELELEPEEQDCAST